MDAPSTCFLSSAFRCGSAADAGFALPLAAVVGGFNGVGALDFVFASGGAVFFSDFTGGNGTSAFVVLSEVVAVLRGFTEPAGCTEVGDFNEICGAGMIAGCGLTTSSGFGAGVTSRIEASPVVRVGTVLRAGMGTAAAICGVEWDTGCVVVSFVPTRSLFLW